MSELHSEASAASPAAVLVGVINHQHPEVLDTAARLATTLGLDLVCAYTVTGLDTSEWREHGGLNFETLEPDAREELGVEQVLQLQNALGAALDEIPVAWSLRILVGDPVAALEEFAIALHSPFLVIGSPKRRRFGFTVAGLQRSTVARLLAHRRVPVLVIPPAEEPKSPDSGYLP